MELSLLLEAIIQIVVANLDAANLVFLEVV